MLQQQSLGSANRAMRRKVRQPLEAINIPQAQLNKDVVLALVGMSRSAWYRLIAEGKAPQPLRFGRRCSRWLAADIQTFLARRAEQGGAA